MQPFPWQSLPLMIWLASLYYFFPALLIAAIFLLVPALRRNLITRSIGILGAVIAAISILSGVITFIQFGTLMASDSLSQNQRTHHLQAPATFAGITFPAGSTVVLQKDHPDFIETATVPTPVLVYGLPMVGQFSMPAPSEEGIPRSLGGTLAQPATIAGLPCAAGKINTNASFTSCILAQPITLHGFALAGGTFVQTRQQPGGDYLLEQASLAQPTTLFGVLYPAGTIFTPDNVNAHDLALPAYPPSGITLVCLEPGAQVTLGDAILHGPLAISYSADRATISNDCPYKAGDQDTPTPDKPTGFGLYNNLQFLQGTYDPKTNHWTNLHNTNTPTPTAKPLEQR